MTGRGSFTAIERARRSWTAHGRSPDDLTVLHAFCRNPAAAWSPDGSCMWYGIWIDRPHRIVEEFVRCGIVRPAKRQEHGDRWNGTHDWAVPNTPAPTWVVQERWKASAGCAKADLPSTNATPPAPRPATTRRLVRGAERFGRGTAHDRGLATGIVQRAAHRTGGTPGP